MTAIAPVCTFPSSTGSDPRQAIDAPRQSRVLRCSALTLLGLLLLSSGSAMAATFCVATGNELAAAMETAAFNGQNDEIRIRTGTLTRSGAQAAAPRWLYDPGAGSGEAVRSISISGGWTSCSTQVTDPRLSVLDAQNQGPAVYLMLYNNTAPATLSNLTITRGLNNGSLSTRPAANLSVRAPYSTATILLDRLIVVAGRSTAESGVAAGVELRGFGDGFGGKPGFTLRNSVIAYNAGESVAGLDVNIADAVATITNNSIFSNTATSQSSCRCVGMDLTNDITTYVSNNVVVNNVDGANRAADVRNRLGSTYLRNNHFGTLFAEVPPVFNLAMTTGAPGWTLNGIYPVPDLNSPLRDSGTNAPAGGISSIDLAGNPRLANGTVDRGAIEAEVMTTDTIFADSFQ